MRGVLRAMLALTLMTTAVTGVSAPVSAAPAGRPADRPVNWWTEPSATSIFKDSVPTAESGHEVALDTATNEYESAQIVLRSSTDLSVKSVDFSPLRNGSVTISNDNLTYNFVTYQRLNANSPISPPVRKAPGDFPDNLSNAREISIPAWTTQSIWVTVHVPKGQTGGSYRGTSTVRTNQGDLVVPMTVDVRDVAIPDPKDGAFNNAMWNTFNGEISQWPDGDNIKEAYGYDRFSPKWWKLMENVAAEMKEHRTNNLTLPLVGQLLDGGSWMGADGTYNFNWTRFDQVVQFFLDRQVIKRLEGFWTMAPCPPCVGPNDPQDGIREVEIINRDAAGEPIRDYVNWDSAAATNFIDQFIPALRAHLEAKGWDAMYWMHIMDEPGTPQDEAAWRGVAAQVRSHWPSVKLGDALVFEPTSSRLAEALDLVVPNLQNYHADPTPYDAQRDAGKELWFYTSSSPQGNYLNRFIDQPQWHHRLITWFTYSRGASGYLHYSMNGWVSPPGGLDNEVVKGDHYIVWPDKANNTIESSIRYESLRDGIEDYEVLNLLGRTNRGLAKDLTTAIVQEPDRYVPDTSYMARIRQLVLDAAAGKPLIATDLARGAAVTASSQSSGTPASNVVDADSATAWQPASGSSAQWLQVDLGQQAHIDGVRLNWQVAHPTSYKLQVSYDGVTWTDAPATSQADGGDDFVGVNGKGRYLRLELAAGTASYGLTGLEVAGQRLATDNVVGGRSYTVTPSPDGRWPDTGIESTDGVLADAFPDGRTYGFADGQPHVDLVFDLERDHMVDRARIHAYEEYPGYRPSKVTVSTSTDGVHYRQKGSLSATNDQSRIWYEFQFPRTTARYVKVSFDKTFTADESVLFIDEVEVYGAEHDGLSNVAEGQPYTKSSEPDDPFYPDTNSSESTDGQIGGTYKDGLSYGYYLELGESRTVAVTIDLGGPKAVHAIQVQEYFDGVHHYAPDQVTVSVEVGDTFVRVGEAALATDGWYHINVDDRITGAVRIEATKQREGRFTDYLFLGEIAVIADMSKSPRNLLAGSTYNRTTTDLDPDYPDSTGTESTDGVLAGQYIDGLSWAYHLQPGATLTADIDFDLGARHTLSMARFREYFDSAHNYRPDRVTILTSDDAVTYTEQAVITAPTNRWFEAPLEVSARYVRFRVTKTDGPFADYIFIDELEAYGLPVTEKLTRASRGS